MSDDTYRENAHWARRRRPVGSAAPPAGAPGRPHFARFAAAMDAARAARSPQLSACLEVPAYGALPVDGGESGWRAAGRPLVRWLGIGACVLLLGLLLATLRTQPIGAAIERLIAPERAAQQDQEAAPALAGRTPPVVPERTAARDRPPLLSPMAPLLVSQDLPPAARPVAATPPHPAPASAADTPDARPLPIPVLKPPPADH